MDWVTRKDNYLDVASALGSGRVTKQGENGVDDLVGVVQVQSRTDRRENGLVGVLLRNLTANRGRNSEVGEKGNGGERLDEDHGEN